MTHCLTLPAQGGKGVDAAPNVFFSREYRKNALAYLAEIYHNFASIFLTLTLKNLVSCLVTSGSNDDVMFGRNRRILPSTAVECHLPSTLTL